MYYEGKYIFANTFVVTGEPKHQWLLSDPEYREAGTFTSKDNEVEFESYEWDLPKDKIIPKSGTFDELREALKIIT